MQLPHRLNRFAVVFVAATLSVAASTAFNTAARAADAPGLCTSEPSRGSAPGDFALDACIGSDGVWIRNNLSVPVDIGASGDVGGTAKVATDMSTQAQITRLRHGGENVLMPGDVARIGVGGGTARIEILGTSAGGTYALATALASFLPLGVPFEVYQAAADLVAEVADVYGQYRDCLVGKNWLGRAACTARLSGNVAFAVGRFAVHVASGTAAAIVGLLLDASTFLKWADSQVPDVSSVIHGTRTIEVAARAAPPAPTPTPSPTPAPPTPTPPAPPAPMPQPAGLLTFDFSENPFRCDGGSRRFGTLRGAAEGEKITFTSPTVSGLLPGTADGNGNLNMIWQCNPNEAGQSWTVTATSASGRTGTFTVTGASTTPITAAPPAPQPQQTWPQTTAVHTKTFTNYMNAGVPFGAEIPAFTTVQVSCRLEGFRVQDGNTWWYRIAQSPWNNQFYVTADVFYNNGQTSGSLAGTPFVDEAVPLC